MVHGVLIAAMLTLVGDNGSGDQMPSPGATDSGFLALACMVHSS
jgi:hypothetical protein